MIVHENVAPVKWLDKRRILKPKSFKWKMQKTRRQSENHKVPWCYSFTFAPGLCLRASFDFRFKSVSQGLIKEEKKKKVYFLRIISTKVLQILRWVLVTGDVTAQDEQSEWL